MSSPLGENQLIGASGNQAKGYEIDNSCRFNMGDSSYLSRTPSSGGSRRVFTLSVWFKYGARIGLSEQQFTFLNAGNGQQSNNNNSEIQIRSQQLILYIDGGNDHRTSVGKFRDPSAWYHIVVAVNTNQGVNTNVMMYVNGDLIGYTLSLIHI